MSVAKEHCVACRILPRRNESPDEQCGVHHGALCGCGLLWNSFPTALELLNVRLYCYKQRGVASVNPSHDVPNRPKIAGMRRLGSGHIVQVRLRMVVGFEVPIYIMSSSRGNAMHDCKCLSSVNISFTGTYPQGWACCT